MQRRGATAPAGSPTFLEIEHVDVGPGSLHARVAVRDDLLTPFGNLHGGVLSALCDHVLGTVLYPGDPARRVGGDDRVQDQLPRAVTDGVLDARAEIVSLTKRTAVVRIDVENEGRLVCAAQGTVLDHAAEARRSRRDCAGRDAGGCGDGDTRKRRQESPPWPRSTSSRTAQPTARSSSQARSSSTRATMGDAMFAVVEGEIELSLDDRVIEKVGPGGIIGEMALIDAGPRSATATATATAASVHRAVDQRHFMFLVHEHPTFALQVMKIMADRIRAAANSA